MAVLDSGGNILAYVLVSICLAFDCLLFCLLCVQQRRKRKERHVMTPADVAIAHHPNPTMTVEGDPTGNVGDIGQGDDGATYLICSPCLGCDDSVNCCGDVNICGGCEPGGCFGNCNCDCQCGDCHNCECCNCGDCLAVCGECLGGCCDAC